MISFKYMILAMLLIKFLGCNRGEREMHIIPKSYTGVVKINFDQPTGDSIKYENGRRVYVIPANGTLNTQFKFNHGWIPHDGITYYYLSEEGKVNEIPFAENIENFQSEDTIVYKPMGFKNGKIYFICRVEECSQMINEYYINN